MQRAALLCSFALLLAGCEPRLRFDQAQLLREINESGGISNLVAAGVIHQVEVRDGGVSLIVGPAFDQLSYDRKMTFVRTVADLVGPTRGGDHFLLYDSQTDKKVGAWRGAGGLQLD
jgi:hypothetical protein